MKDTSLDRSCLDHALRYLCRYNLRDLKTRLHKQCAEFLFCAFAAARHQQHLQIEKFAEVGLRVLRQHAIDHDDLAILHALERAMSISQNSEALLIVPVMDDVLEVIRVRPRWDCFKEVSR